MVDGGPVGLGPLWPVAPITGLVDALTRGEIECGVWHGLLEKPLMSRQWAHRAGNGHVLRCLPPT
eukprot:CAMPEP_0118962772 /NCGR_PEP_ID=MMETSP1173-20130426/985_1 /TAXON_ID=1034831 /ORGANISM="Rhizochromulina marina cf, Strain CCMP1243" /LENGTH=64 /DNA_ID=CAMNT_0006911071 /DNA_START=74 /DNA_END=264 /DNA_ORIENTATION=+